MHWRLRFGKSAIARPAKTLLGAPGLSTCIASSNKSLTSSNKKLLGAPGLTTRSNVRY